MLNIGGGEVLVILLVALIVLGPTHLPDAVKQVGKAMGEFRKISAGFQQEFSEVLDFQTEETARERGRAANAEIAVDHPDPGGETADEPGFDDDPDDVAIDHPDPGGETADEPGFDDDPDDVAIDGLDETETVVEAGIDSTETDRYDETA